MSPKIRVSLLGAGLILAAAASSAAAAGSERYDNVVLFQQPPSAYELARTLFPPKKRTIVLSEGEGAQEAKPKSVAFLINFEYDSTVVLPESQRYLDSLGNMLNFDQLKDKPLAIEGHADASGEEEYNLKLSEARAQAIKDYLVSIHRIAPDRLHTQGYGEAMPLDHGNPTAPVNRRAEFRPMAQ